MGKRALSAATARPGDHPVRHGLAGCESNARFSHGFAQASDVERRAIFDSIAFRAKVQPGYERPAFFFARLRGLVLGGFYSLPRA